MHSPSHAFSLDIAVKYGVDEAIVLNLLLFWIVKNKRMKRNQIDHRTWTYMTREELAAYFPYWSPKIVRRICDSLVEQKVIVISNYNKSKFDKTLWYALYDERNWFSEELINSNNSHDCPNGQIEFSDQANGFEETGKPIPDTKPVPITQLKEPPLTPQGNENGFFSRSDGEEEVLSSWLQTRSDCTEDQASRAYWAAKEVQVDGRLKKDLSSWMLVAIQKHFQLPEAALSKNRYIARAAAKIYRLCRFEDDILRFSEFEWIVPVACGNFLEEFSQLVNEKGIHCLREFAQ